MGLLLSIYRSRAIDHDLEPTDPLGIVTPAGSYTALVNDIADRLKLKRLPDPTVWQATDGTFDYSRVVTDVTQYIDGVRQELAKRRQPKQPALPSAQEPSVSVQGTAVRIYPNGDRYEGEVNEKGPHGKGTYYWHDGTKYEGSFVNGLPEGFGVKANGATSYVGTFKSGLISTGTYHGDDGLIYEGPFDEWKPSGNGKATFSSGDRYEGEFHDGMMAGRGTYSWADGDSWNGPWVNQLRDGAGVYYFRSGDKYVGTWKGGKPEGRGTYIFTDGRQQQAEFAGGQRTSVGEKEVDLSSAPVRVAQEVRAGSNYLLYQDAKIGLDTEWTVWADGPFELNVKGIRLIGPIPNPFDSGWQPAKQNFKGVGRAYGLEGRDGGVSLYLVVRTTQPVIHVWRKPAFVGPGQIRIDLP
jgi:hypothetical protein